MKRTFPFLLAMAVLGSPAVAQPQLHGGEGPEDAMTLAAKNNQNACGAVLCLAGMMMGNSGGDECSGYIEKYFEITVKSAGDFNPTKTAKKRLNFLKECKSSDPSTQQNVNDRYGTKMGL